MKSLTRRLLIVAAVLVVVAFSIWKLRQTPPKQTPPPAPLSDVIPPGIVVTETSTIVPPPPPSTGSAPGDRALMNYASPSTTAKDDMQLLSNSLTNFLTISKQAATRPLSANEEWSASLRGKRPGVEIWISDQQRILDSQMRLVDRWGSPLHFHALGAQKWEIRSAGPDLRLWSDDDLLEQLPRVSTASPSTQKSPP